MSVFVRLVATGLENLQSLVAQILLVSSLKIVDADQHRVVHDLQTLQKSNITLHLLDKGVLLGRAKLEMQVPPEPVEVLQCGPRVLCQFVFLEISTNSTALEIKGPVDVSVRREEIVHDDKMDLAAVGNFDPVEAIELTQKCVWISADMVVILS